MNQEIEKKYIDLVLNVGIALKDGQCMRVSAEPIHWNFVNSLIKEAYNKGAKFVATEMDHPLSSIHRANNAKQEYGH